MAQKACVRGWTALNRSGWSVLFLASLFSWSVPGVSGGAPGGGGLIELDDTEYQSLAEAAGRFDHLALLAPGQSAVGVWLLVGDRFGLVRAYHLTHGSGREVWKSKQLSGTAEEILVADLDGDGAEEILARTTAGFLYIWSGKNQNLLYESLATDFQKIHAFATGNVDGDEAVEVVINADRPLHYLDGVSFNREWTSLREYEATRMRCGDVDGDRSVEIVLNTGQVIDSRNGDVEWADEVFGARIDLADVDGDLIPEVLSESDGAPVRIFDVDLRKEKHLQ